MSGTATARKNGGLPRWGINRDYWVRVGDEPFLDRKVIAICPWFAVLLTRIHSPDAQRDPHDHSRWFASFILSGAYSEKVWAVPGDLSVYTVRRHARFSLHVMPADRAHLITGVTSPLRTLVLAGKTRGTWSFWTAGGKVDWKAYKL